MSDTPIAPIVLVTGAARRVGAAIVRSLHAAGCQVAIHCLRSRLQAEALAAELETTRPGSTQVVQADLLDMDALQDLVIAVVARFGRLDGLVNNASGFHPTPVGKIAESDWNELIGSNLKAPLFLTQAAAPYLIASRGAVVNIVDIHAERPLAGYPVYSAAKAGLLGLTRSMAIELAPHVRVNGVSPGPIEWPDDDQFPPAARESIIAHTLLQRTGTAAELATVVRFLLLEASYVSGQILAVDGGRSARL